MELPQTPKPSTSWSWLMDPITVLESIYCFLDGLWQLRDGLFAHCKVCEQGLWDVHPNPEGNTEEAVTLLAKPKDEQ